MSVDAFTVDGTVNLNIEPFESAISKVTTQLTTLSESMTSLMEMGGGNWNFNGALNGLKTLKDDIAVIKEDIATMNSEFANVQGINALKSEITTLRTEMDAIKEKINQMGSVAQENVTKVGNAIESAKQKTLGWSEQIAKVTEGIVSLMTKEEFSNYILEQQESEVGQINAQWREMQGLIQSNTTFMREIEASGSNIARYFTHETQILERNVSLLEQEAELTNLLTQKSKQNATTISNISKELGRVTNFSREVGTYFANEDKILRMSLRTLQEQDRILADKLAKSERETALAREIAEINKLDMDIRRASANAEAEMLAFLESETGVISSITGSREKGLAVINEELALEKEKVALIEEETALLNEQGAVRQRNATKGNKLDKMGYLPSRIGSMALTMWGFNELMDVYDKTTTNIYAKGSYAHFGKQLQTDERYLKQTGQTTEQVTKSLGKLDGDLRKLQKDYRKIDMKTVGANAEETAFKYGLQADAIGDLSEVMAIYGSEFVKQGRSQEDSILALNDALDGELRRLKEVNVTSDELKEHGWKGQGDQIGMIKALKEIAEERGYDVTAKEITNLSDAITYAELQLAFFLSDLFEIAEPSLRSAVMKLATGFGWLADRVGELKEYLKGLPQPVKDFLKEFGANAILGFVGLWIGKKIWSAVSNMSLFGGAWEKLMEKLGRTKGMDKATESMGKMGQTTGGTVSNTSAKDGLKNWGKNLAKNLGKMAEVFIEVAVALVMAWALMKEAILLIEDLGKDFEAHKEGFEKGWAFLKDYGVWILGVSAVLTYFLQGMSATEIQGWGAYKNMAKGFGKVALGLALAMGLIAEAIVLLIAPMKAIEVLGWMYGMLDQANIQKGNEVIGMYADALDYIASNDNIGYFIIGLTVVSAILGFTADTVGLAMAIGIASTLLLVAEAIVMLIAPLVAVEMLGHMANELDANAVKQGANAIKTVGECLQILEPSVRNILAVDFEVFGIGLVEKGNEIVNGKSGFKALTEDILPNLFQFVKDVSNLEVPSEDVSSTVATITQIANSFAPMVTAIQKLTGLLGGDVSISFMGFQIESNSGIRGQLDRLYEDIRAVMDFANKLGGLGSVETANTTAITQISSAITQLKAKLDQFVNTISSYSNKVQTASDRLGKSLPNGFKSGASTFSATVVQVLASGISEVQARYNTMNSGGKALGQKLVDGFKNHKPTLKTIVSKEIGYALTELDNAKDDFYSKGQALGKQLSDGFESSGGLNVGSPANIARTIAKEMEYSMLALDTGKQMMYKGGQALGRALTNGYNSYGNLRTDVGVLAQKGVNSEQLQANAKNTQLNGNIKGQNPQLTQTNINIDMSNSTVIGVQDLDNKIRQAVEKAIVSINSPNGAIGY